MNKNVHVWLAVAALALSAVAAPAGATLVVDTWQSNDGAADGNYKLTVDTTDGGSRFAVNLTVDPWNAEVYGLFVDFGDFDYVAPPSLYDITPAGEVVLSDTDTSSSICGSGPGGNSCNVNGLNLGNLLTENGGDGEWELAFQLADQGFDGIQTFSWSFDAAGLTEADWHGVAVRSQQLCTDGGTLDNGTSGCGGSEKVYASRIDVPEPSSLAILGIGLIGAGLFARRRS